MLSEINTEYPSQYETTLSDGFFSLKRRKLTSAFEKQGIECRVLFRRCLINGFSFLPTSLNWQN